MESEKKVYYQSFDDVKLCGILSKVNDDNRIVVFCHGLNSDKSGREIYTQFAKELRDVNINSFRFDFRAHGESGGNDYEMNITKEIKDVEATLDILIAHGYNEIILHGSSFGGGIISLLDYSKYKEVKAIILWYAALDFNVATTKKGLLLSKEHREIARREGYYTVENPRTGRKFRIGESVFDEAEMYYPYKNLIKQDIKMLFLHGTGDMVVPYQLSENVSKMCKNSQLELIKNGSHAFSGNQVDIDDAIGRTKKFILESFKESKTTTSEWSSGFLAMI